jgi:hypothetical protein
VADQELTPQEQDMIAWIDQAAYLELLRKNRFEPSGSPWFTGAVGDHFVTVLGRRREEVGNDEHVRCSKLLGWG